MATQPPDRSQPKSSTPSAENLAQAQSNLESSLEAYRKEGEEGLEKALDQIYPQSETYSEYHGGVHFLMVRNPERFKGAVPALTDAPPSQSPQKPEPKKP